MSPISHLTLLQRRLTLCLALWLALMGVLAPMHGAARAQAPGAWRADICVSPASTAANDTLLVASPDGREAALLLSHCPFCLLGGNGFGPPATASAHPFASESGLDQPAGSALFFESRVAWLAVPRGPPTVLL